MFPANLDSTCLQVEDKEGGRLQAKELPGQTAIIQQQQQETKNPLQAKTLPEQTSTIAPELKISETEAPQASKIPTPAESVENERSAESSSASLRDAPRTLSPQSLNTGNSQAEITSEPSSVDKDVLPETSVANADLTSDDSHTQTEAKQKGQKPQEEAGLSDNPESAESVQIVPQPEKSAASATPATDTAGTSPAAEALTAANPQEDIQLPTEATTPAEGEKTEGKQGTESGKPASE